MSETPRFTAAQLRDKAMEHRTPCYGENYHGNVLAAMLEFAAQLAEELEAVRAARHQERAVSLVMVPVDAPEGGEP